MLHRCYRVLPLVPASIQRTLFTSQLQNALPSMAAGQLGKIKVGKAAAVVEKKVLPVETDPQRLVQYCCGSNIMIEGEDIKLGPDSEYPDWLWELDTSGHAPPLETLDPNTLGYWWLVRNRAMRAKNRRAAKSRLKG